MKTNAEKLKDLGYEISSDTIIIEIKGGMLQQVHNDPNGYVLFDWDNIRNDGKEKDFQNDLDLMLKTLDNPNL